MPESSGPALAGLVVLGGTAGGLARLGLLAVSGSEPAGLLVVNVLGSGLLGLLVGLAPRRWWLRPLLGTGVLGGFTTFSAALALLPGLGSATTAAAHLGASLLGALLAALGGLALGERLREGEPR